MDGSIKKESDLPAADPNTPIPLKYEDGNSNGASAAEKGISLLLERGLSALLIVVVANLIMQDKIRTISWLNGEAFIVIACNQRGPRKWTRRSQHAQG